ncbi:hypothetical protein [Streptomyces zaehneri]|uniref:hypothetical protein n=1 Tax=Streptomyces zaehneri TaxID=3051180 RepID=UPI0028D406F3|nr:hypothetical protein [Streptomyces sp. DSM 40713]
MHPTDGRHGDRVTSAWRPTRARRDPNEVVEVLSGTSAVPADKARTIHRTNTGPEGATEPVRAARGAGREVLATRRLRRLP